LSDSCVSSSSSVFCNFQCLLLDRLGCQRLLSRLLSIFNWLPLSDPFLLANVDDVSGPAVKDDHFQVSLGKKFGTVGVDIVPLVSAPASVAELLTDWRRRHRRRFGDRHLIGCDVGIVPVDPFGDEWRLSTTEFECRWIRQLPKAAGVAFAVAKWLAKQQKSNKKELPTYPVKMSLLWCLYFGDDDEWRERQELAVRNALIVLRLCAICAAGDEQGDT
jgi:hypothetical protein